MVKYNVLINGAPRTVDLIRPADEPSEFTATIDGRKVKGNAIEIKRGLYSILMNGRSLEVRVEEVAGCLLVRTANRESRVEILDPRSWRGARGGGIDLAGRQQIAAPMAGKVVRVLAAQGQRVEAGQGLLVVEAMKMQNEIFSPKTGIVERLHAKEGQTVEAGEILAVIA
jgi:biotin carboxyl carrier protein